MNDVPQPQWVPAEGEPMPKMLRQALLSPDVEKWAWNASFEMNVIKHILKMPVDIRQWRDTMVLALSCSLPGKLEKAGPVVDLGEDCVMEGMAWGEEVGVHEAVRLHVGQVERDPLVAGGDRLRGRRPHPRRDVGGLEPAAFAAGQPTPESGEGFLEG